MVNSGKALMLEWVGILLVSAASGNWKIIC